MLHAVGGPGWYEVRSSEYVRSTVSVGSERGEPRSGLVSEVARECRIVSSVCLTLRCVDKAKLHRQGQEDKTRLRDRLIHACVSSPAHSNNNTTRPTGLHPTLFHLPDHGAQVSRRNQQEKDR
jgi:hypothetical protein